MSSLSTHILDATLGQPARQVLVQVVSLDDESKILVSATTDNDGRIRFDEKLTIGDYKVIFLIKDYFKNASRECFYPKVEISFSVTSDSQHYHVPLLISPYSFSTYRGS